MGTPNTHISQLSLILKWKRTLAHGRLTIGKSIATHVSTAMLALVRILAYIYVLPTRIVRAFIAFFRLTELVHVYNIARAFTAQMIILRQCLRSFEFVGSLFYDLTDTRRRLIHKRLVRVVQMRPNLSLS